MFNLFKKKITVATHNGSFHADDVFAVATLRIWAEENNIVLKVVRTRDPKEVASADIAVDVGDHYDPEKGRLDHHQKEGAGQHSRDPQKSVPYASFGLVWKHYGEKICDAEVAKMIEEELVMPIDAVDNGINITNPNEFGIVDHRTASAIHNFNITWQENINERYPNFLKAVKFAKEIIKREIANTKAEIEGGKIVLQMIADQGDPEILIIDSSVPWKGVANQSKNVKLVVYPSKDGNVWCVQVVRDSLEDFNSDRVTLPLSWRGTRDEELQRITGIPDAIFCHRNGFIASTKSKEGALEMARKALL